MYGFSEMMMEEAEKQFSQEGRETMTKERLAIGEAIHAMKWLDQHFKGWGLEKECAILENLCSNYKEKEIQTNHNYLDLQYQLDGAESEIESLQDEINIIKKRSEHNALQDATSARIQMNIIKQLREELTIANIESLATNDIICSKDVRIKGLEDEIKRLRIELEKMKFLKFLMQADDDVCIGCAIKLEQINELEADSAQSEICIRARMDVIDEQAARIKDLETQVINWTETAREYTTNSDYWQDRARKSGDKNMIRLICKKVDNDELPYHVRMIVNDNKEYYGLGKTIGGAINRIESLSGVNINHHVHEFDDMDICKHCKISKESLSNVYRLVESNIVQKV